MKIKTIIICMLLTSSVRTFCQEADMQIRNKLVSTILLLCDKAEALNNRYETERSDEAIDSLNDVNHNLYKLFTENDFRKLNATDLQIIRNSTEVDIIELGDAKLVSWCVLKSAPVPMCSNVFILDSTCMTLSLNGVGELDYGENVRIDSVYFFKIKNKNFYLFTGSNRCGSLCIQLLADIYLVNGKRISKCGDCFVDGKKRLEQIKVDYLINDQIKSNPAITINRNKITIPVFDDTKTRQIGKRKLKIISNGE